MCDEEDTHSKEPSHTPEHQDWVPNAACYSGILGPFPESEEGNSYIITVADYFTCWIEAYPIPNQEARTVAKKIIEKFIFLFLTSRTIALCTLYHPQSDGLVEQYNKTLLSMLATAASENAFNWEAYLKLLRIAYNTSINSTTGFSPFFFIFGCQAQIPIDVAYGFFQC